MLAVALCRPRVIARLEQIGVERLDDLADRDPTELVLAVNLSVGHPIWHAPIAERAMANLVDAAAAQRDPFPESVTSSRLDRCRYS